ncbi:leucine-rich repeat domain-containing protein [bacterium]|nr:leucine-rich repeat domain-containing protein [bacterium]
MIHHAKTGDKTINSRKEQQNQCLSKSSVGAPFTAAETFKVLFSALNILAFFISLNISVSHAQSDCEAGEQNCWDCGKTENDLCTARLDTANKALSITGTGEMRDYSGRWYDHTKTPWGVDYTSVSVQGVKNIGAEAFEDTSLTSVNIGDTVKYIGNRAFDHNTKLTSVIIPDSVTGIDWAAFFNNTNLAKVFISESVTDIETFIHTNVDDNEKGPFDRNNSGSTLYCAESTPCYSYVDSNVISYTKDSNGVYKIGDNYYASPDDMLQNQACGSGNSVSQECISAAAQYQDQKAENMAGGALCATKEGCLLLIDMANKKEVCQSIADCNNYAKDNEIASILCPNSKNMIYQDECLEVVKLRYTLQEANEATSDDNENMIEWIFE